jgi:hypothetical protein
MLLQWLQSSLISFDQRELIQFNDFLGDMESENGDVLCYTEVSFLNRDRKQTCLSLDGRSLIMSGNKEEIFSSAF